MFKSDQEPSILALKARIIEALGSDFGIVPETSDLRWERANGTVERATRAARHRKHSTYAQGRD